jgi:membrane associated rhomboid family serine protease
MSAAAIILTLTIVISVIGLLSRKVLEKAILRPQVIAQGNAYATLLTSGFVHADFGHLIFNLITYYSFAFPLDRAIGDLRFEILYFSAMLVGNLGTCIKHRNEPNYASLGASGAILGVLFASIVYFPRQKLLMLPIPIPIPAPLFAVAYLAFSWYSSGRSRDHINHDAHIFGALTGLVFVLVTAPERFRGLMTSIGL